MDTNRPGIIRYSLTVHFKDQGLVPDWWFAAINPVLERAVARATGNIRIPSEESSIEYLARYMREQCVRELDPTSDFRHIYPPVYAPDKPKLDWAKESYKQENNPLRSKRWQLLRRFILNRDSGTCCKCGAKEQIMHVDHIKPRSRYPELTWEPDNLQTLCKPCNKSKFLGETDYRGNRRV